MLDAKSRARLDGVHPDLARVIERAAGTVGVPKFRVTEGLRSAVRQRVLLAEGKSWTMNSRHLTGHAVDLCLVAKTDAECYDDAGLRRLADVVLDAAEAEGVVVEWGGHWRGKKCDTPHYQLSWATHPAGSRERESAPTTPKPIAASAQVQAGIGEGIAGVGVNGLAFTELVAEAKAAGGLVPALSSNPLIAILFGLGLGMLAFGIFQVWERRRKRRNYGI